MKMMVSPYKKQKTHHVQSWTFRHQAFDSLATAIPSASGRESTQIPNIDVECWGRLSLTVYTTGQQGSQSTRAQRLSGADQRQLHKLAVQPGVV